MVTETIIELSLHLTASKANQVLMDVKHHLVDYNSKALVSTSKTDTFYSKYHTIVEKDHFKMIQLKSC